MNSYTFTNGFHGFFASLINFVHNFVPSLCLGSISMPMHECKQSKRNGRKSVKPISDHSKTMKQIQMKVKAINKAVNQRSLSIVHAFDFCIRAQCDGVFGVNKNHLFRISEYRSHSSDCFSFIFIQYIWLFVLIHLLI